MTDPYPAGSLTRQDLTDANIIFVHSSVDDAGLLPSEFRIYGHIARRAGAGQCYPGIDSMAKICRMDKTTVIAAIAALEEKGMIAVERKHGKTSRYNLTPRTLWKPFRESDPSEMRNGSKPVGNPEPTSGKSGTKGYPKKDIQTPPNPLPSSASPSADASGGKVVKAKKEKKPRAPRPKKETHPEFQAACDDWCKTFETKTGSKYPFTSRDGKAVNALLSHFKTWRDAKAFIVRCRKREAEGYPFSATRTLYNIADKLGELLAALADAPRGNGRHEPIPVIHQKPNDEDPPRWRDFLNAHNRPYIAYRFEHPSVREGVFEEWLQGQKP